MIGRSDANVALTDFEYFIANVSTTATSTYFVEVDLACWAIQGTFAFYDFTKCN